MLPHHQLQISALTFLCLLCAFCASAQEQGSVSLSDVVVTATRTPKQLKDVPIQTQLITAEDIERTDATNVQDLLQQELPGVEFSYAMNQQVHLNFSGFGGQSVLFLVDGERLAGETLDDIDFTRLNMANVERIEIVRGAASALYGSNAGGGVINLITRQPTVPWQVSLNARLARHHEQRYGGSLSLGRKVVSNTLDFNYTSTDNYNVTNAPNPAARVFTTVYGNTTYDFKDKLTIRPLDGMKLTARAGYFYRTLSRIPDTPERYRDFTAGLRALWDITAADNIDLSYSFDQYDKSDYQKITRLDIRDYSNVQNALRLVYSHHFDTVGTLTAGADYLHDYLFNPNLTGRSRKQDSFDAFAQMDWTITPRWEFVGALRYDYFSDTHNSHITPRLTACYRIPSFLGGSSTLRFGYGMGFRAPTLKEKYYSFDMAGIWTVQGNPQLKSELSHNLTASLQWTRTNYSATVSTYYNNVSNKIATGLPSSSGPTPVLPYLNLDRYSVYGAEATLQARWKGGFSARLCYAFTKEHLPRDKEGNSVNNQYLPARPHSLTARFDWDKQFTRRYALSASVSGRFLSAVTNTEYIDYYDISRGTATVRYPAYTIWKLAVVQRIGTVVKITLALDNIFNYRPRHYYLNAPVTDGINFQAGVALLIN